jgi:uncharacterized protein YggE
MQVRRVLAIHDGGGDQSHVPYSDMVTMDAAAEAAPPPPEEAAPFNAGINTAEVRVRVHFALGQ